ncbi:MAG: hypothetical protein E6R04_03555 [Spirochaetes bacterium]|nr:MAG: hypothetical protein E6R04_03555 [Spirochaetota bacterium]
MRTSLPTNLVSLHLPVRVPFPSLPAKSAKDVSMSKTMTTEFIPSEKRVAPLLDSACKLEKPLVAEESIKPNIFIRLLPLGVVILVVAMFVMLIMMGRRALSPMMFMMPLALIMGMFGMSMHGGGSGSSQQEVNIDRKNWLFKLRESRKIVHDQGRRIHALAVQNFPNPKTMLSLDNYRSMWQVRKGRAYAEILARTDFTDHPFMSARAGRGMTPLNPAISFDRQQVVENLEPVTAGQFGRFLRTQRVVANCPLGIRLDEERSYSLRGTVPERYDLVRSMILSLAHNHSPNELVLGIIADPNDPESVKRWNWMKWLPHTQNTLTSPSNMPPLRLAWSSMEDFAESMELDSAARNSQGSEYAGPRMLVFVDLPTSVVTWPVDIIGGVEGVGFVLVNYAEDHINDYVEGRANLFLVDKHGNLSLPGRENMLVIDRTSVLHAENVARSMSRWRPSGFGSMELAASDDGSDDGKDLQSWFDVLGIHDIDTYDPRIVWKANAYTEALRVPLGYKYLNKKRTRDLIYLDIVEMSRGGSGPHGCVQGKTGTGKSYLLNNWVLTLCTMFGPDKISFILADFKAGAAFDGFEALPQVIQVLTNLEEQKELVDRAGLVLAGEIQRREEFLHKHRAKDILEYRKMCSKDPSLEPLPDLLFVADEFHEFMTNNRDYVGLLNSIGAKGRSLGMKVVPCSQFIDSGLLSNLMQHLTFGISLTASSAAYSRTVLDGDASAVNLPAGKGHAMIRYIDKDTQENRVDTFVGFSIEDPYVSKVRAKGVKKAVRREIADEALPFGLFATGSEKRDAHQPLTDEEKGIKVEVHAATQKSVLIEHLSKFQDVQAPKLWQRSLTEPMTLADTALNSYATLRGISGINLRIGDVDDPFHHKRPPYVISPDGNIVVVGRAKAGKSMAIMAMVASSALVYRNEVNWYLVDYVGGGLAPVENFPNVGGYATKTDMDTIERFLGEFYNILDYREKVMSERRISRVDDYLEAKRTAPDPRDPYGHMFLVLDGFDSMVQDDEEWKTSLLRLLMNGGRVGLHVVVTAPDIQSLPIKQQSMYATLVPLGVDDPARMGSITMETRQRMKLIPNQSGRGVDTRTGLSSLIMVPKMEKIAPTVPGERGQQDIFDYRQDHAAQIRAVGDQLSASLKTRAPQIAVVGDCPSYGSIWETFSSIPDVTDRSTPKKDRWLPLGVDTRTLVPTLLDKTSPHFIVAGSPDSGKTSTLRALITSVINQYGSDEAKFMIFDPSYGLMNEMEFLCENGYMKQENYAASRIEAEGPVSSLAKIIQHRTPERDKNVTPRQIADRSWFDGPEVFVIIDEYSNIGSVSGMPSPIESLVPLMSPIPDMGVHLFISTSAAGFGGMTGMNKMIKMILGQNASMLLLDGPSNEGSITSLKAKFAARRPGRGQLLLPAASTSTVVHVGYVPPFDRGA